MSLDDLRARANLYSPRIIEVQCPATFYLAVHDRAYKDSALIRPKGTLRRLEKFFGAVPLSLPLGDSARPIADSLETRISHSVFDSSYNKIGRSSNRMAA